MWSLQNRLPSTQAERADDLLNEATELLEQHREVTNEEDYNMARALLTIARDFRHGLERKSIIRRSQQSRLYLDKVQETLETVKQVTLEGSIRIQGADASAARGNTVAIMTGAVTNSEATSNDSDMVSLRTTIPAGAFTTTPLPSSAPIRGPTLQVVLDHIQCGRHHLGLPSPPDALSPQGSATPYDEIALVSNGAVKELRPSNNPAIAVSHLPTPPLTPETPAKYSPANPTHTASD